MAVLALNGITKHYGEHAAVNDVSLEIADGELVALLGPSGCGKTTLLRSVAGFLPVTSGRMLLGTRDITHEPPYTRNTGMVFQSYALFPHMTVGDNVGFGLRMRSIAAATAAQRVADALKLVHLEAFARRFPRELSGGQQQRVALARALVIQPDVLLLDEPLSNLDAKLRQSVGLEIRALQKRLGLSTLFVTHDQVEALALADRLVVMNHGRIVQSGSAEDLYERPATTFVANFLGQANLLPGRVEGDSTFVIDGGTAIRCATGAFRDGARGVLCVRPEHVRFGSDLADVDVRIPVTLEQRTYLGPVTESTLRVAGRETMLVASTQNRTDGHAYLAVGQAYHAGWRAESTRLLPEE